MAIKNIPHNILISGIAIVIIAALVIFFHKKPPVQQPVSSAQQTDSSLGLYTDSIQNKNATTPPKSTSVVPSNAAPSACTLSLQVSGQSVAGGTGKYVITASNVGKTACSNASLSLYYDPNETYSEATPAPTSDGYYWVFGTLGYEETKTISLSTTVQAAVNAPLQGCLSADNGSDACSTVGESQPVPAAATVPIVTRTVTAGAKIPMRSGQELGVWEWNDVEKMSTSDMEQIAEQAAANGFTTIYLTIDHYLDLYYEADPAQQAQDITTYTNDLESFAAIAAKHGLTVDAEAGWRDWAEPARSKKAVDILSYVAKFNVSQPVKLGAMQYDIEPYLLSQYDDDKASVLGQYLALADTLEKQSASSGVPLILVLPYFYGSAQQWTPLIDYNGKNAYAFDQLLNIMGRNSGNSLILMAYRNTAEGTDGAISLVQQEIQDASSNGNGTKIIIAQETGNVDPSYVTFYNTSRAALFAQVTALNDAFAGDSAYAGIAIDYLDPFLKLQ